MVHKQECRLQFNLPVVKLEEIVVEEVMVVMDTDIDEFGRGTLPNDGFIAKMKIIMMKLSQNVFQR